MTLNDLIKRAVLIRFGYSYHYPDESTVYLVFNYEDYGWGRVANQEISKRQSEADLTVKFVEKDDKILVSFYEVNYTEPFVETLLSYNKKEFEYFIGDNELNKRLPLVFEYLKPDGSFTFNISDQPMILSGYEISLK